MANEVAPSPLFRLPLELREEIYSHYLHEPAGYYYDGEKRQLHHADGRPPDLALQFTCRSIAAEMRNLVFQHNSVTFTTLYDTRAHQLDQLLTQKKDGILTIISKGNSRITSEVLKKAAEEYPEYHGWKYIKGDINGTPEYISALAKWLLPFQACEPGSVTRQVLQEVASLTIAPLDFKLEWTRMPRLRIDQMTLTHVTAELKQAHRALIEWQPTTWSLPSQSELSWMSRKFGDRPFSRHLRFIKFHFSAMAVTLDFLQSIGKESRSHLRKIVVNEDRKSVAFAEVHAQGLIAFCIENPRLRIEHHVSVHRTLLVKYNELHAFYSPNHFPPETMDLEIEAARNPPVRHAAIGALEWIDEAMLLPRSGMPPGSYSLVFDGSAQATQQIWDFLKLAVAKQEAVLEMGRRGIIKHKNDPFCNFGRPLYYISTHLPRALQEMIEGTSFISIPADKGEIWDMDETITMVKRLIIPDESGLVPFDYDEDKLDLSDLGAKWEDVLAEFCIPRRPHRGSDALENWEEGADGFELLFGENM